jgi:SAM-dependent methyltransferase
MTQYGKLCSTFYALDKPEARPDALTYYLERAAEAKGPILEPMCGTGRYLLPLLAAGFDAEGTDASADMLTLCREQAHALGVSPVLHEGYLQELALSRSFSLIMIPSGSFSLLIEERDIVGCLARLFEALKSGGRFLVEVERAGIIEPSLSGRWEGRWLTLPDGSELIQSWLQQYSGVEGVARSLHRYELITQGQLVRTEFENFAVKHHEPDAFRTLLTQAGFTEISCVSPYERTPLGDDDEGMLFECRKA